MNPELRRILLNGGTAKDVADLAERLVSHTDNICGSEPPRGMTDERGREWEFGDCWCTLAAGHNGLCFCGPCTGRYGAPGWTPEDTKEQVQP